MERTELRTTQLAMHWRTRPVLQVCVAKWLSWMLYVWWFSWLHAWCIIVWGSMLQGRLNMNNWSAWVYQSTCLQHCFEPNNAVTVSIVSGSTNNFCKSQLATWKTRCVWYIYIHIISLSFVRSLIILLMSLTLLLSLSLLFLLSFLSFLSLLLLLVISVVSYWLLVVIIIIAILITILTNTIIIVIISLTIS